MVGSYLPPGFRFHPTDEELVGYYLHRRNEGLQIELEIIPLMDLYKFDPWELPEKSFLPDRDMEWFFFCHRDRKYQNGSRINRATKSGYWKATGKDRNIVCHSSSSSSSVTGCRKTLVFYMGRAPFGGRTEWVMHEYRLFDNDTSQGSLNFKGDFALCRVIKRNEHTRKKSETNSPEVSDELLSNNVKIFCQASDLEKGSCDASNTLWSSPDFILESFFQGNSQSQTEEDSGSQVFPLPELENPPEVFADLNFDWEMDNPFMFDYHPEAHMNNEVMSYHILG
ncbi:unnamed protein product [Arabidopsis lyrata]|uniref:ANAC011 n=1 Tax=Arabidopsis lyrata subsp. lyrata TaxID=81972 RepID=D7KHL2_ARALL|nr:NAC domain-containing protein 86 [Arabidopsis lyrata subsp. lyrata]EFH67253.1 ANAC011 [Arabidopsis lyrata subsp. lyrata]CAH8254330.1 unnamed protein product [Arabidopsis lyrata]|eukprot:XP_002890994.1 NAC domain-containing protein 86 [Arabidopsis lyrata subsp. lyrata]